MMNSALKIRVAVAVIICLSVPAGLVAGQEQGVVRCANLIYANGKTSVCFSSEFLTQIRRDSNILADPKLHPTRLESPELYDFPFAIMTGEGNFSLTSPQREAMHNYLTHGGFVIASAGCSDRSLEPCVDGGPVVRDPLGSEFLDIGVRIATIVLLDVGE